MAQSPGIGTVDVLKACDACADMGQLLRSVHFYEGLYSVVSYLLEV